MSTLAAPIGGTPRVNLMPRSEIAKRERDSVLRGWMWGVLGAVLVALLIIGGAFALKWLADQRLAAEEAKSDALLSELAGLSEVSKALATEDELTSFRAEAMASDLAWTPVLRAMESTLPDGAALTAYEFVTGGVPQGEDPTAEVGLVGKITLASGDPIDIVTTARSLRGVPGVLFADGESVTSSAVTDGAYAYVLNVILDQSIYSGEFAVGEEQD